MCWKAAKVSYDVGIKRFLILHSNWGQNFRFLRMLNSVQNRISAALPTLKESYLLNCLAYQGVKITIGHLRKYSITLVFSSGSDSSHVSTRVVISDCYCRQDRINDVLLLL
jgi:hypothetical protein